MSDCYIEPWQGVGKSTFWLWGKEEIDSALAQPSHGQHHQMVGNHNIEETTIIGHSQFTMWSISVGWRRLRVALHASDRGLKECACNISIDLHSESLKINDLIGPPLFWGAFALLLQAVRTVPHSLFVRICSYYAN